MFKYRRVPFSEIRVGKRFLFLFAGQDKRSTLLKLSGHSARVMSGPSFPLNVEFTSDTPVFTLGELPTL